MKQLGQIGNGAQLWMYLLVKVKSDALDSSIAQEPGMLSSYCRQIGHDQAGDRAIIDILGISEVKWKVMGEFNSDDHYIYY